MSVPDDADLIHPSSPRGYLKPCLLLLLRERSDHGYNLVGRLAPLGLDQEEAASVYRALRELERDHLVRSRWGESKAGPHRRVYDLTAEGARDLARWVETFDQRRGLLGQFIERYSTVVNWPAPVSVASPSAVGGGHECRLVVRTPRRR